MARFFAPWGTVHNKAGKALVVLVVIIFLALFGLPMLLFHKPLRWFGRNGFYFDNRICLGGPSFKKRE